MAKEEKESIAEETAPSDSTLPEDHSTPNDVIVYVRRYRALLIKDPIIKAQCEKEGIDFGLVPATQANTEILFREDPDSLTKMLKNLEKHAVKMLGLPSLDELYRFVRGFISAAKTPKGLEDFLSSLNAADQAFMREQTSKKFFAIARAIFGRFTHNQLLAVKEAEEEHKETSPIGKEPPRSSSEAKPEPVDQEVANLRAEMQRRVKQAEEQIPPDIQEVLDILLDTASNLGIEDVRSNLKEVAMILADSHIDSIDLKLQVQQLKNKATEFEKAVVHQNEISEETINKLTETLKSSRQECARRVSSKMMYILTTFCLAAGIALGYMGTSLFSNNSSSTTAQPRNQQEQNTPAELDQSEPTELSALEWLRKKHLGDPTTTNQQEQTQLRD